MICPAFTIDVSDVTPGGRENQQVRFTVISDFRLKPFTFTGVEYDAVSGIGRLSVTPLPNAFGTSDVILQLEDAGLDNDFSTTEDNAVIRQVITISVTPVNDQPVAQALEAETDEDTSIRVLLPVMDIEGLETASVSITNASVVPLGAVGFEIISGSIWLTYDPSQVASIQAMGRLDSMTETIAYEVNDGDGGKTEAVITILVRGKNDWYHHSMPLDVNGNMTIEPLDVLVIINRLNSDGSGALAGLIGDPDAWYDVNDDGSVSPIDALIIINHLNGGTAEGERIASGLSPSGYYREIPAAVPKSQTVPRSDARSSVDPRQELAIGYPAFTTSTPGFEYDDTDDNWKEIDELIDLFVRDTAPKGDWWQE